MDQDQWSSVDQYFNSLFIRDDSVLKEALAANAKADLPSIDVSPTQGKFLHLLALARGAKRILEIGTLGGYSSIWMARALPPKGKLITLEAEPMHADVAAANIARAGLAKQVEIRLGAAAESLQKLVEEKAAPFDFIFIDADKESYPDYLRWSLKLARVGTLIVADNVVRQGEVIEENTTDARVRGARTFLELLAAEPRVTATAIQTVGSKGYDGFALAVVTSE